MPSISITGLIALSAWRHCGFVTRVVVRGWIVIETTGLVADTGTNFLPLENIC
jgi:hypothetical protein